MLAILVYSLDFGCKIKLAHVSINLTLMYVCQYNGWIQVFRAINIINMLIKYCIHTNMYGYDP